MANARTARDRQEGKLNEEVMSAVIVSVAALRRQNCEIDEDIASVLERSAADRLDIEMERMQALMPLERK